MEKNLPRESLPLCAWLVLRSDRKYRVKARAAFKINSIFILENEFLKPEARVRIWHAGNTATHCEEFEFQTVPFLCSTFVFLNLRYGIEAHHNKNILGHGKNQNFLVVF